REREVRLQQPLEGEERLVVERDGVEVGGRDPAFAETVRDGVRRERRVVLEAGEALLLRRRHDPPVADEAGRGVVVETGEAEDGHGRGSPFSSTSPAASRTGRRRSSASSTTSPRGRFA